ncbi:MAG: hypothetical protein E5Y10_35650 [Mesorhizobium sp.]|nr:MAG: hypothetical protein E5Y13_35235 [Mesorhizobium sp.]TJU83296.1 MAG: hypothetical protein E5Y10_35650 [Mesorhizobium sp.]
MGRSPVPLSGIKVVDFGQYIAGPATAMILADFGATVVHIDPPSGPLWESPANATLNRNKLVIPIDLKSEEGVAQALALIGEADIVIENFRPGVLARLGIVRISQKPDRGSAKSRTALECTPRLRQGKSRTSSHVKLCRLFHLSST